MWLLKLNIGKPISIMSNKHEITNKGYINFIKQLGEKIEIPIET